MNCWRCLQTRGSTGVLRALTEESMHWKSAMRSSQTAWDTRSMVCWYRTSSRPPGSSRHKLIALISKNECRNRWNSAPEDMFRFSIRRAAGSRSLRKVQMRRRRQPVAGGIGAVSGRRSGEGVSASGLYFRRQRIPSFVCSMIRPAPVSSARTASES